MTIKFIQGTALSGKFQNLTADIRVQNTNFPWPWPAMLVGDVVAVTDPYLALKAQASVNGHARCCKKKFSTKIYRSTKTGDPFIIVERKS